MAQLPVRDTTAGAEPHLGDHNGIIRPVHNKIENAILTAVEGDGFLMGPAGVLVSAPLKRTRITGTGTKTTGTSIGPIDATNLGYLTLADLTVGQIVRCVIDGQVYASSAGDQGNTIYDVEVDRPISANHYAGAANPSGYAVIEFMTQSRVQKRVVIEYTVGEAGSHGFRPVWYSLDGTASKTMRNGTSGADGTPITWTVNLLGTPAA